MATIFVNPGWNYGDNPITVYILNGYVYKTDPGEGRTEATCYSSLAGALGYALSGNTIYVYNNNSADSLPIPPDGQSGTYKLNGETYSCTAEDRKNLSVQAYQLRLDDYTSFALSGNITTVFSVSNSIVVGTACYFLVENGAAFELSTLASFVNWGTISVTNGSSFSAASASVTNNGVIEISGSSFSVASVTNSVEIKIIGSSFSADSVVNTGNSTFTVTYTSTLNIGNLTGTIKTGSAGTTLNTSSITGGGANGGTITAQGDLTFTGINTLKNITLNATGKTVNAGSYNLRVGGTSTLNIGTLSGTIWLQNGATVSNSTISGGDGGGLFIDTSVIFAGENQVNAGWTYEGHYTSIANCGLITVKSIPASGDNPNALDYVPAQRGVLKAIDIWNKGSITVGSADAENADACSIEVTNLTNTNNNSSLTVTCNAESANPSRLKATQGIVNNGMMTLTNSELTANTLTNNGSGISQSTAGMTISNSTVSASGENPLVITNGNSNTFATIEFNNSTVTAGQVTNFSFHNGQDPTWGTWGLVVTNQSFFSVTDLSNTGWIQVTDSTLSATSVYIGKIDNERNYSGKLQVNGTSTLDIASLEGTITIGSSYFPDPITLKDSHITGKVDNGNRLGNISVTNPLTFTGANTLTNISVDATANYGSVTVGTNEGDSLTVKGTSSLRTASLNGTILTDSEAATTLTGSNITGGGTNGGTITAQNDLTFTGENTLRNITLNATNKNVTNNGTLTVGGTLSFDGNLNVADNGTITVDALSTLKADTVSGGMITVLTEGLVLTEDVYHVVDANLQNVRVVIGELTGYTIPLSFDSGVYLFKLNPSTVYVNRNYPDQGELTDGHLVGVNAFKDNPDGTEMPLILSSETEKIVYYANENAYAALNLAVDNAPASLTITTEAVEENEVVTMGPLTVGAGQTVALSGAKMSLQTVNNAGTINVTNSTFAASTLSTSAVDDRFCVAGESTLNIDSLNGKIKLNHGATVSNSTVYSDVNVGETTTSCSGRLVIATGSSVTFAGANTFRDSNNEKGIEIGNLGSVTVKSIAASGDDPAASDYVPAQRGVLKVFGFDNVDTLTVGSDTDACTFDVINLNNHHALTVNGKTDDLSRLKASLIKNYGTIELTNAIAEAGSLQNGNEYNTTTTIEIANSEFTADSVTNYSSGANARDGMTVINSTLFKANSLVNVNNGTIKFRGKNKLDIRSLSGTLYFDVAEGTQATLNDSSITGGTLQAVSVMKFTGANTLRNITVDAAYMGVTVGTDEGDSLTVSGTNTLIIKELNGAITTANSATLQNSNITGGAIAASGSVTVNNSTISSNTFTCNTESYFGVTFTGTNTLNSVTLDAGYVTNGGSLTVKGESELHIGDVEDNNRENGTIKLDGATIINSSIVGGAHGGTLLVESGKTATFSTTGSNRNNLANTSIINSGTSATSYGTITVNGKMTCGTVTNNAYAKISISNADFTAGTVTNLAEGLDSTGAQITVKDSSFTATTVSAAFHSKFNVEGASSLNITNLNGTIRLNDGATISNSAVYADINNSYSGELVVGSGVIFAGSNTFLSDDKDRGLSIGINGSATVKSTSNQKGVLKAHHIQVGNLTVGSETDACIVDTISLKNGGTLTVNGKTNDRSSLRAVSINNYDNTSRNGSMSLTNTVLNTETLVNTCVGTVDNKPGITITNSEAFVGSLRNGNENYRVATIKIENSEFTAGSITNYSKGPENEYSQLIRPGIAVENSTIHVGLYDNDHNVVAGTGDINNASATITVTNSEFTALGTLTINCKQGLEIGDGIRFTNSTVSLASIINNGTSQTQTWRDDGYLRFEDSTLSVASVTNRGVFLVLGTSKLDIGTLDGTIETSDSGATLNDSSITGGGTNGGTISARNSLTFTGANTLNGITLNAAGKTVTVGNSASLTVKGTSTLNIGNLNGTILTDSAATTTLKASSITNGTISAQGDLTFTGSNTLNGVTLTATNQTVTIDSGATLNVNALSRITASAVSGGVLNVTTTGLTLSDMTQNTYHVVNADLQGNITVKLNDSTEATSVTIGTGEEAKTYNFIKLADQDLYLTTEDQSVLYVNSAYTEDSCDGHVYGYNAFSSAEDAALVAAESGAAVDVGNGTYTEITELRGAKTVIQKENGTTEFTKAVYGGTKVDAEGSVTRNMDVTIEGGTFGKFFVGGNNIAMPTTDTTYTVNGSTQSVAISGGTFQAIVATADRVQKGAFTLNSVLEMNISGGQFNYFVAGGLLNSLYEKDGEVEKTNGTAEIHGDVSLNITGGTFDDDCWIYGGCVSTSRSVSSYASTIYGNVTITIDCGVSGESERNDIVLSHVVAGSHGLGHILENSTTHSGGNTAIVFKGDNNSGGETPHSLIRFTDDGELWGGCGRDNLSPVTGKCADSFVQGDRLLSFEGFTGELNCKQIRDFSSIQLIDESNVTLTESTVNLRGFETWTFEYDSYLSGNFGNDFNRDTLNLTGLDAKSFDDWTILTNSSDTAFKGFGSFSSVSFGTGEGSAASYSSGSDVWYNDAYVLYCSENSMLLTTNASYVTRFGSIA